MKIIVCVINVARRLFGLNKEPHIAEIRCEESVVCLFPSPFDLDTALDLDFALVGIGLLFMIYVPAERNPEFIYEVFTHILFRIGGRKIRLLVLLEISDEMAHTLKGCIKILLSHVMSFRYHPDYIPTFQGRI
ncbi:MAG TPA: hypothetical protein VF708_08310 [Pyrinomonadaceae bacterium]